MKKTLKIISIVFLMCIVGYAINYWNKISFSGDDKIKIIENYESISSVNELVNIPKFDNKILYIDMWGVYCAPCIKEFKYIDELKDKFKNEPVEFLYLATPYNHFNDIERWKAGLKKYNLEGYNMLMSIEFYDGIWKEIPEMQNPFLIPHYLIIGKNGKIVNPNAPRPSSKELLYKEIAQQL